MIVMAIDPGFEKIGYSLFEKKSRTGNSFAYITSGLIKTSKKLKTEERIRDVYTELQTIMRTHKPGRLVMEQLFFFKNQKTVIGVAQAQGAMMLLSAQEQVPLTFLTPLQIKQIITGYGNADKKSVYKMVTLQLKQNIPVEDDDQSDAIACGLAYCYMNEDLVR